MVECKEIRTPLLIHLMREFIINLHRYLIEDTSHTINILRFKITLLDMKSLKNMTSCLSNET